MSSPRPSELLEELRPNLDAERRLKELLVAEARAEAERRIGADLARRVSATEVACSAADSLMSDVKHGRVSPKDAHDLFGLARHRARSKAIDAIRKATSAKRDVGRESGDVANLDIQMDSPEMEVSAKEVARELASLLCEAPDEMRRCINLLGLLREFDAKDIREALMKQDWIAEGSVPTIRTIHLWLQKEKKRLAEALKRYDDR